MNPNSQALLARLKRYPVLLLSALVGVALIATLYMRSDLVELQRQELARNQAESERYRLNIANAHQLEEQLDFMVQANKAVRGRALVVGGLARNLQYFYRLESELGIKYIDLRPGPPAAVAAQASIYVPINYIMSVQGDFAQLIGFIKRLEQGGYFARINSVMVVGSGSSITLNLNLDLLGVP
jgi:hypothetical protein